ncbi:MAG: MFS transporter [Promethearchaeota archaeon]
MNKKEEHNTTPYSNKKAAAYSTSQIVNTASYQTFSLLTFTFYFAVIGINVNLITIGFIIWSVWNSINDPILGAISDRTHTKWGRRFPYIMISIIPLALISILLYYPPLSFGITNELINFAYFLVIIIIFELFFTMFDVNLIALFPELFITVDERSKANGIRMAFYIFGLLLSFVLPTIFIPDFSNKNYLTEFQIFGVINAAIIIVFGLLFLKISPKERIEFQHEYKNAPSLFESVKTCIKNKTFMTYVPAEIAVWFVIGMQTMIVPLYGKYVLNIGEGETIFLGLLLGIAFISSAFFINILWKPVVKKTGPRKAWLISVIVWILTLIPLMFITDKLLGLFVFFLIGIGLAGPIFLGDLILADIIDEDETNTGTRREAGYYGVKAFFFRLSTVFVVLAISTIFTNAGWAVFEPETITQEIVFGLRALMFIFPAIALSLGLIAVYKYPLDGEKLKNVKKNLQELHAEKQSRV